MVVISKPKPVKVKKHKRPKKAEVRRLLEKKADVLCKNVVILRDGFCVCPAPKNGHSTVMQAGHLVTRSKESVKWDLYNVSIQCSSCNLLHEFTPHRYTQWFIDKFGISEYKRLCDDSENVVKLTLVQLEQLCCELEKIYECQQADRNFKPRFTQKEIMSGEWKLKIGGLISGVQNEQDIFQWSVGVEQGFSAERQAISKVV